MNQRSLLLLATLTAFALPSTALADIACTTTTDCPVAFDCVDNQSCSTAGCNPNNGEDCSKSLELVCTKTEGRHCEPQQIACTDDTGCPEGWSCGPLDDCGVSFNLVTNETSYLPPGCNEQKECHPPKEERPGSGESKMENSANSDNSPKGTSDPSASTVSGDSGCTASGRATSPASAIGFAALALGLVRRRTRSAVG